jgi:FkbM family methyltransferase
MVLSKSTIDINQYSGCAKKRREATLESIRIYYPLAGAKAILALIQHKVFNNYPEVAARVSGIPAPIRIRVQSSDFLVLRQVLLDREYESPGALVPSVIIDAGANIGVTSVFYANRYPGARIFAIEPEISNFEMLVKNAAPYKTIVPIHGALWSRATSVAVCSVQNFSHWGVRVSEEPSIISAPAFTVSDLMSQYQLDFIDILKLDIEGAEMEVFETSGPWIGKVGMLAVETHDRFRPGCSNAFEEVAAGFPHHLKQGEIEFAFRAK